MHLQNRHVHLCIIYALNGYITLRVELWLNGNQLSVFENPKKLARWFGDMAMDGLKEVHDAVTDARRVKDFDPLDKAREGEESC